MFCIAHDSDKHEFILMCDKPYPKGSGRKSSVPQQQGKYICTQDCSNAVPVTFSQEALGSLCCLLSVTSLTAPSHTGQLSGTLPQCLAQLQEAPPIKILYFPSLTVSHCFTKKVFKIFCNSTPESQTSVNGSKTLG